MAPEEGSLSAYPFIDRVLFREQRAMPISDEELIERVKKGDDVAFAELLQRFLGPVYRFTLRLLGRPQDAEDVVQDVWLKVWNKRATFQPGKRVKPWIFQIAYNTAIDALRKRRHELPFSSLQRDEDSPELELEDPQISPAERAERVDSDRVMQGVVQGLSKADQLILELYYRYDLTFREMSEFLGVSLDTLKSRHRRALAKLKKKLPDSS